MIRIGKIGIENFLTIGRANIDFANRGLMAILGPNGSGKSSLVVESLNYGLFGVTERFGVERDRIVNRFVGKNCHIHIPGMIDDVNVVIDAYRKHTKFKDEVFLTVDGVDKRGRTNAHTWGRIEQLLDMDVVGWQNSIVFGQSMSQYAGLTDAQQKSIVERMLGCSWIPKAYELATIDRDGMSKEMDTLADNWDALTEKIDKVRSEISFYTEKRDTFETARAKRIKDAEAGFQALSDTRALTGGIDFVTTKYMDALKLLEGKPAVEAEVKDLDIEVRGLRSDLGHNLKGTSKITDKMKSIQENIEAEPVLCDSCGQFVTSLSKDEFAKHLQGDRDVLVKEAEGLQAKIDFLVAELKPHVDKLNELAELEKEAKKLNFDLQGKQAELAGLSRGNAVREERNANLRRLVETIEKEANTYQEIVTKQEGDLAFLEEERKVMRPLYKERETKLPYHEFMAEFYSNRGFKSYLIESVLPAMNGFADLYSKYLGGKYAITFSPQKQLKKAGEVREKFNVSVVNSVGADVYEGNSNGEKRAIDAIVMFVMGELAASRLNKRVSILILDDVFEKLDRHVCGAVIQVLKQMAIPKEARDEEYRDLPVRESILVLTHLDYLETEFANRVHVGRDSNGQTVINEI